VLLDCRADQSVALSVGQALLDCCADFVLFGDLLVGRVDHFKTVLQILIGRHLIALLVN
jgi:hypothetical protein